MERLQKESFLSNSRVTFLLPSLFPIFPQTPYIACRMEFLFSYCKFTDARVADPHALLSLTKCRRAPMGRVVTDQISLLPILQKPPRATSDTVHDDIN